MTGNEFLMKFLSKNVDFMDRYYLAKSKIVAKVYISKSIALYPDVLYCDWWESVRREDPAFHDTVIKEVNNNMNYNSDDPIMLAKYGKILFIEGDYVDAKLYLTKSVSMLPNLIHPWFYLSMIAFSEKDDLKFNEYATKASLYIEDFDLLKNGIDSREFFISDISNYSIKFKTWYSLPWSADLFNINLIN